MAAVAVVASTHPVQPAHPFTVSPRLGSTPGRFTMTDTLATRATMAGEPAADAPPGRPLRRLSDLPGPKGWPVLGVLPQIKPMQFHLQLQQWAREYGRWYQVPMGQYRMLVTGDHEAVAQIMRDRPDGFRRTQRLENIGLEMGLKPGLFGANGDVWRRQRRMVMSAFDPGHVKAYYPSLIKCAQRLLGRWQGAATARQGIALQPDLMRFTVDAIAGLAFGTDVNTLQSDDDIIQNHLNKIFPKLHQRIIAPLPYWRWFKLPSDRALDFALAEVSQAIDGFIATARARLAADPARRAAPDNLLEAMIVAADAPDSGIDDRQVAGNVLTMLLAGEDTTANTLAWAIWFLHRHPAALARATDEARAALASADGDVAAVAMDQLAHLDFIEACMHETMRLKPVAPQMPLQALRDTVVGDVAVPAGGIVLGLLRHDSIDEAFVPRALEFVPERWLGEQGLSATSAKRISMPFGAGPRICPGRYLALQEMKMVMLVLLGHFDIASVATDDGQEPAEELKFAMAPVGLTMRLALHQPT
jgi:cytochrome P450